MVPNEMTICVGNNWQTSSLDELQIWIRANVLLMLQPVTKSAPDTNRSTHSKPQALHTKTDHQSGREQLNQ